MMQTTLEYRLLSLAFYSISILNSLQPEAKYLISLHVPAIHVHCMMHDQEHAHSNMTV